MNVAHLKPGEAKDTLLRFRVTKTEHSAIMEQAKKRGFDSFSDYIRELIKQDMAHNKVTDLLIRTVSEAVSEQCNK